MAESIRETAKTGGDDLLAAMTRRLESAYLAMFGDIDAVRNENAPADPKPSGLDSHRDRWDSLLEGKVSPRPPGEVIKTRQVEAHKRAELSTPPGYLDTKKKEGQSEGDYLIWCEALDQAKSSNRPLIFITNDKKADWYETVSGQTVGPRPELRREMHDHTGGLTYWQEDLQTFLHYSANLRSREVRPETIKRLDETTSFSISGTKMKSLASLRRSSEVNDRLLRQLFFEDEDGSEASVLDWRLDRDVIDRISFLRKGDIASNDALFEALYNYYSECERVLKIDPERDPDGFAQEYSKAIESRRRLQALVRRVADRDEGTSVGS